MFDSSYHYSEPVAEVSIYMAEPLSRTTPNHYRRTDRTTGWFFLWNHPVPSGWKEGA